MPVDDFTQPPKEMVKVIIDSAEPGAQGEELPFRMSVVGDFTGRIEDEPLQDKSRKPKEVNNKNFNEIMSSMKVETQFTVPNRMGAAEGIEIPVDLKFESIKDFHPDRIAEQIPQLKKLLEMRQSLIELKRKGQTDRGMMKLIQSMAEEFDSQRGKP